MEIDPNVALIVVSLITSFFGIVGMLLWQRGGMIKMFAKGDLTQAKYDHQIELQKLKNKHSASLKKLGSDKKGRDLISQFKNVGLEDVREILDQVGDLGEFGDIGELLSSPLVKGILGGIGKRKGSVDAEEEEEFTSQV